MPARRSTDAPPWESTADAGSGQFEFDQHAPLLPISTKDCYDEWDADVDSFNDVHDQRMAVTHKQRKKTSTISTHRRHHMLANLFRVASYFVVACWALAGVSMCGWAGWFFYTRHNAYAKSIFAFPLEPQPLPVEHLVAPFTPSPLLSTVQRQLDVRLDVLSVPRSTLPCDDLTSAPLDGTSKSFAERYSSLPESGPYLLALNLYNSQDLFSTLSRTLLTVADFLGRHNCHISIFENGSTDNTTVALAHFAAALTTLGIEHTVVSDPRKTDWSKVDRIDQLAVYRNVALAPVRQGLADGKPFEDVLFVNDVFVGPTDALELLWQRRAQEADAACAMDWRPTKGILSKWGRSIKMYDNWVARSMTGNMLRPRLDVWSEARHGIEELFTLDEDLPSRKRLERGLPIPVYSCWNGMIALAAEPFRTTGINPKTHERIGPAVQKDQRPFRSSTDGAKFRSALRSQGECAASECKTLAKDFWARGYNRWLIVPTVRAVYDSSTYTHPHLVSILDRAKQFFRDPQFARDRANRFFNHKIDWSLPEWTAPTSVACWGWVRGFHIDLEWSRMTRNPPW
ncbi:glycosyltransferase family 69 protein [Sporobolomyces koalae]|uniref:glycosyltransferase family 69 protein n=1 Tax=Sporobolomyces koalae TaxID=500713 RepID=UPI00316DDBE8